MSRKIQRTSELALGVFFAIRTIIVGHDQKAMEIKSIILNDLVG